MKQSIVSAPGGPLGPAPLPPIFFQNHVVNFKGKPRYFERILGSRPPNSAAPPRDENPGSAPESSLCQRKHFFFFELPPHAYTLEKDWDFVNTIAFSCAEALEPTVVSGSSYYLRSHFTITTLFWPSCCVNACMADSCPFCFWFRDFANYPIYYHSVEVQKIWQSFGKTFGTHPETRSAA